MTTATEAKDRPAAIADELQKVERELADNAAAIEAGVRSARQAALEEWREQEGADERRQALEADLERLQRERARLEGVQADLRCELGEAEHEARLAAFDAQRAELDEACEAAAKAARAVDRNLSALVTALDAWNTADNARIALAGQLGLPTNGLMRSGRALQAHLGIRLGKFASEHVEPAWRRALGDKWATADAAYSRIAHEDAERARNKLT